MEEQRQRQEEEARRATAASGEEVPTAEAPIADSEEAMLQQALSMSTPQTPVFDFSAMTEEQQIEYAMRLSLQNMEADAEAGDDKDTAEQPAEKEERAGASAMETDGQVVIFSFFHRMWSICPILNENLILILPFAGSLVRNGVWSPQFIAVNATSN